MYKRADRRDPRSVEGVLFLEMTAMQCVSCVLLTGSESGARDLEQSLLWFPKPMPMPVVAGGTSG